MFNIVHENNYVFYHLFFDSITISFDELRAFPKALGESQIPEIPHQQKILPEKPELHCITTGLHDSSCYWAEERPGVLDFFLFFIFFS